jgi:hypothetical protein
LEQIKISAVLKSNLNFKLWAGPTHQPCSSLSSGLSPACQRPTLLAGPSCQSPLSVLVPRVSSLLTLCHTPHTPSCHRSHQGYLATQETHLSFQRQGQYHPHRPLFLGNISYAHGDLVHMCTNRILALHSSSNFLWQKGFFLQNYMVHQWGAAEGSV